MGIEQALPQTGMSAIRKVGFFAKCRWENPGTSDFPFHVHGFLVALVSSNIARGPVVLRRVTECFARSHALRDVLRKARHDDSGYTAHDFSLSEVA